MARRISKEKQEEIDGARESLLAWLPAGATVYALVTKVARDGMSRKIKLFTVQDGSIINLSYRAALVLGWRYTDDGIHVNGCGMDMCFHTVYSLSQVLYGATNGYDLKQRSL